MSMYAVNASVPKTLIKYLVRWAATNVFTDAATEGRRRSAAEILIDIADTPISPELTPADSKGRIRQKTEDLIGPYELHDFFIYNFIRYGYSPAKIFHLACRAFGDGGNRTGVQAGRDAGHPDVTFDKATILKWLKKFYRRFCSQQFKRSCMPDGPKISLVSFSPRGDWRMPSDAQVQLWISDLDKIVV